MLSASIETDLKSRINLMNIRVSKVVTSRGIMNGLYEMGRENVNHTRNLIKDKRKTGRIYIVYGRPHRASDLGEAPANLSGKLVKSVDYKVRGCHEMEFGDGVYYGKYLEKGTSKMGERPHLKPTVKARGVENKRILLTSVDKEIKKRGKI